MMHVPNQCRIRRGPFASSDSEGNNGAFKLGAFMVIASDEGGWEHVSASLPHRVPTWEEMCNIKSVFWDADDCVVQYHPPAKEYVNMHQYCLHLWRPIGIDLPRPPSWMIGFKT